MEYQHLSWLLKDEKVLTVGVIGWLLQWKEQQDQSVNAGNHEVTNTHQVLPKAGTCPYHLHFSRLRVKVDSTPLMIMSFSSFIFYLVQSCYYLLLTFDTHSESGFLDIMYYNLYNIFSVISFFSSVISHWEFLYRT